MTPSAPAYTLEQAEVEGEEIAVPATATGIRNALSLRYARPEYQLEFEVTLGSRRLDGVAVRLWSGYALTGFEIKVSRADFLRELDNHRKSEEWCATVDSFYLITTEGVVSKAEEIPDGWGWLCVNKTGKLRLRRHPVMRTPSADMPREVAVRLLNRVANRDEHERSLERMRMFDEVRQKVAMEKDNTTATQLLHVTEELRRTEERLREMEAAFGVNPRDWMERQELMKACKIASRIGSISLLKREVDAALALSTRVRGELQQVKEELSGLDAAAGLTAL